MFNDLEERESDFDLKGGSDMVRFQPTHGLMARPRLREQDLQPQRIFFMRDMRKDGEDNITAFTEAEAANILKSSHGPFYRQVGCSDGKAYDAFLRSKKIKAGSMIPKSQAEEILRGAWAAELEVARGHFSTPQDQNVHFDNSFPIDQRKSFVPPR